MKPLLLLSGIALTLILTASKHLQPAVNTFSANTSSFALQGGQVMAVRELKLRKNSTSKVLERFAKEQLAPTFEKYVPGVRCLIMHGERGDNKGKYMLVLLFDSDNTRNFYFPVEGVGEPRIPETALKLWRPGQIMLLESLVKYTEPLESQKNYTNYLVLP
jgi:hypothetical protein